MTLEILFNTFGRNFKIVYGDMHSNKLSSYSIYLQKISK